MESAISLRIFVTGLVAALLALEGRSMTTKPGYALQDVRLAEGPFIVQRGDRYYLHYRVAADRTDEMQMRMVVATRRDKSKAYYYFVGFISRPESGELVERPLASDGLTEFAQRKAVYWLNPDGSETPLKIRKEPEHSR